MLISERRWLDMIERWLTWLQSGEARPGTLRNRAHYLAHLAGQHRTRMPEALDVDDLVAFVGRPGWKPAAADFASLLEQAAPGTLPDVVAIGVLRAHVSWATSDDEASAVVRAVLDAHAASIGRAR